MSKEFIDPRIKVITDALLKIEDESNQSIAKRILADLDDWLLAEARKRRSEMYYEPRLLGMKLCNERKHEDSPNGN